jgi:hypothetical protein
VTRDHIPPADVTEADPTEENKRATLSRELSELLIELSIAVHRQTMYPPGRGFTKWLGGGDAVRDRNVRVGPLASRGVSRAHPGQLRHPLVSVVHAPHGRAAGEPRVRATAAAPGLRSSSG